MNLRRANVQDLQAVHQIRQAAILGIVSDDLSRVECLQWAAKRSPDYFAPRLEHGTMLLAENAEGQVVGWGSTEGERIEGLYVRPDCGGQGVGRRLMAALEGHIRQRGHRQARLAASANAVGFYRQLGYVPLGPMKNKAVPMIKEL